MKKIAHILKPSKGSSFPSRVIFFDTETVSTKNSDGSENLTLSFGIAAFVRWSKQSGESKPIWYEFTTKQEFWKCIEAHCYDNHRLYVSAHNLAFDARVVGFFTQAKLNKWKITKLVTAGVRNIWQFRKGNKTIVAVDNMNWFSSSLETLGKSIGLHKLVMPEKSASPEAWKKYNRRDVEIMIRAWSVWRQFIVRNNLGNFGLTLASQALNAFRHRFNKHEIYIHNNDSVTEIERASYHGGRTEAFVIGELPVQQYYYLDVVSMYPSVMREYSYPTKLVGRKSNISVDSLNHLVDSYAVTAVVEINTRENVFALVRNTRLIFPTGRFITTLTTREIKYALRKGIVSKVLDVVIYEAAPIFREYVNFFFSERQRYKEEGNQEYANICKLLLNSLYGKFGQRNDIWSLVSENINKPDAIWEEYDVDEHKNRSFRLINGRLEEKTGFEEAYNSFTAIAAHVTADARMKLWYYMKKVGLKNVLYVDTDSIFTTREGYKRARILKNQSKLGDLSVKGYSKTLSIYGAKDYVFGGKQTTKGIRNNAKEIGRNMYRQTQFQGLKGAWRKGKLDTMVVKTITKKLNRIYKKGHVLTNGSVIPYDIPRDDIHVSTS